MIQTMFVDKEKKIHETEEVRNLKKRFKDVGEEAHDLIDRFVSDINVRKIISRGRSDHDFEISLNLADVMRSLESIKEEFNSIHNMKMDSSSTTDRLKTESASASVAGVGTSFTRNAIGKKKVRDDIVVGFDHDVELIRDKLVEDKKQLDVVSIVGMGGLGKTTLATKVFNDRFVVYHFQVRAWATVSQTYNKQDLLVQLLVSIGKRDDTISHSYFQLREMLHRELKFKRYLIVVDDIWSNEAWDDIKLFFPNDDTASRILLTSRLNEVASHAKSHGLVHHLTYLSEEKSWELLRKKVFPSDDCPEPLIEIGMNIARNCHGLPLAVVVIAGVLAKKALTKDSWEIIARSVTSYIVSDENRYIETLALSINSLPSHLRDCLLYLGGFPEDYKFKVSKLIWLWIAEGFIQEAGNQSLEETAEANLMDLVYRNLIVVQTKKSKGTIKTCSLHDVLREVCLEIATKERFCHIIPAKTQNSAEPCKRRRIFVYHRMRVQIAPQIRSLLSFYDFNFPQDYCIMQFPYSWMLLTVLDLQRTTLNHITQELSLLVHLRYLGIWYDGDFPSLVCKLWSLQTLIIRNFNTKVLVLPDTISNLVNLRHLWCRNDILLFPPVQKPMNLQTISDVLLNGPKRWVEHFPRIKKLTTTIHGDMNCDFKSLTSLETLKISWFTSKLPLESSYKMHGFSFPASLKCLTLSGCKLPWCDMSKFQHLPKLEVLKLLNSAFVGSCWNAGVAQFQQLKVLKMDWLNIMVWKASSENFPCLKQLVLKNCFELQEIPHEIGYIPTLEYIEIDHCNSFAVESANRLREEQYADGNFDLNISVRRERPFYQTISVAEMLYSQYSMYEVMKSDAINQLAC